MLLHGFIHTRTYWNAQDSCNIHYIKIPRNKVYFHLKQLCFLYFVLVLIPHTTIILLNYTSHKFSTSPYATQKMSNFLKKSLKLLILLFCISIFLFFLHILLHKSHLKNPLSPEIHTLNFRFESGRITRAAKLVISSFSSYKRLIHYYHNNNNVDNNNNNDNYESLRRCRKLLENTQLYDFTPFKRHHRKQPEVDPVYGDEKRIVPTGPNPLHH
ncbi:hypothetical protein RND81_10G208200 [Saponaria officinalis]|uniref:Uncharacterized protein n=1 Tax=Saponaria officinalis TaxID=3572 RepID=A0AAW1I716_SAPOF